MPQCLEARQVYTLGLHDDQLNVLLDNLREMPAGHHGFDIAVNRSFSQIFQTFVQLAAI